MNATADALWQRLLTTLGRQSLLPKGGPTLTPAEAAEKITSDADRDQVRRFVWEYYYPVSYGESEPRLSEADAAQWVERLEAREPKAEPQGPRSSRCDYCGGPAA